MDGLRHLGLLLWLRFLLSWRTVIASTTSFVTVALALCLMIPIAIILGAGALLLAGMASDERSIRWLFVIVYFFWFQISMRGFLGNDFFDVSKLLHLPVSPWMTFTATILGGLAGIGPLFMTPAFVGLAWGLDSSPILLAARIILYGIFLLHMVVVTRVGSYFVQWLNGFRFFREWGLIIGLIFFTGFWLLVMYVLYSPGGIYRFASYMPQMDGFLVYLPPVWFADSFNHLSSGDFSSHFPFLFYFIPLTFIGLVLAGFLHLRLGTTEVLTGRRRRSMEGRRYGVGLIGDLMLEWLPLAFAWHQVKILWRDPAIRTRALSSVFSLIVPMAVFYFVSNQAKLFNSMQTYLPYLLTLILASSHRLMLGNLFGPEGHGIVVLFSTPIPRRWILLGKNIGLGGFYLLIDIVLIAIICLFYRTPEALPVCLAGLFVLITLYSGLGNVASVLAPVSYVTKGSNALRQASHRNMGCRQIMAYVGMRLISGLVAMPFILAFAVPFVPSLNVPWLLVLPATFTGSLIVYFVCLFAAELLLQDREEKVMEYMLNPGE